MATTHSHHHKGSVGDSAGIGNGMNAIGGVIQSRLLASMGALIEAGVRITDLGAANSINELLAQIDAANQAANATKQSASEQCNLLNMQAGSALGSAAVTGLSLGGQTLMLRGPNSQADAINNRLVQQKQLDALANERQTNPTAFNSAVVGPAPNPATDPTQLAVTARQQNLLDDGGGNEFTLQDPAQQQAFPGSETPAYYHGDAQNGDAGLDKQAIAKMSTVKDADGKSELDNFRAKLKTNIQATSSELEAVRSNATQLRSQFQEVASLGTNGLQGMFTLLQKAPTNDKAQQDANVQIAQSTSANAAAGLAAAQQVQSGGAKSIDDASQSIRAAIQASQVA